MALIVDRGYSSYLLMLDDEREYAWRLVNAAERLGVRGQRLIAVSRLARETAWLVGLDGRGTDPRAVASAALYWVWLLDYLRGVLEEPPSPREAWSLTGSSRASFYRAIAAFARHVLRLPSHHPLLRLEARLAGLCSAESGACSRPGYVAGVEPGGYVVLCRGHGGCRPPRGQAVELLLLPATGNGWRAGSVNGYLSKNVTYDTLRLREIIYERFGFNPFQSRDLAAVIGLTPGSAGKLLSELEKLGIVERVAGGWRLRETPLYGRRPSINDGEAAP